MYTPIKPVITPLEIERRRVFPMVRFGLVAFFTFVFSVLSLAQDSTSVAPEDTSFASFQFTPAKPAKFGGAVGFTPVLLYPDYAPINAFMTAAGAGEFS